ncbi:Branched-chain alpha-keto acid dehydrogenase, E1 component, alpha subunit [hydrothermal vent metagenome]|uniref:Branched-chain alpha-keto acid dehydrogenase, E1 component, alpha subunit n=1 Tax=hydrothermal vent metagenome TaxID=652676 RepID=A0A3B0YUS4_9ZZZZ
MKETASFTIGYSQILNEQSRPVAQLPEFAQDFNQLIAMYRSMLLTRTFDKKAIALQRTGQLGTYPSSLGQEAISVALATAMHKDDVLFPYYREYGAQFLRGVDMSEMLLYWGGDERGMNYKNQAHDFPICVPIASHGPHAVGVAYAIKHRKEQRVAVYVLGDGATSKGDFYESINAAGTWQLPMIIVVNNNQWAISTPRSEQTACATIAQKAIAGGIAGEQVDGNDIIALRARFEEALNKARSGGGATLIEALTYRLCDHTTADDASRYRNDEEVEQAWKIEPIARLRNYLSSENHWNPDKEETLQQECSQLVEAAVKRYLNTPAQAPETMFDFMFETPTNELLQQQKQVAERNKQNA